MTFLNPAFLFGLLAAGIPVIIHLLNLRKLQRVEFSTLRFLKELQKNQIRKIKLKQWLLLLLRVLLILFLVTAFSRPALKGVSVAGITSSAKTTAVLIIDNSISMDVIDQDGSLFNKAKSSAISLVNTLQEGDEVAVITTADNLPEIQLTKNLTEVQKKIRDLEISSVKGSTGDALLKAVPLIEQSLNYNREIFIFSDFQTSGFPAAENVTDLTSVLGERVHTYLIPVKKEGIYNAGIDDLRINSEIFERGKTINITVTAANHSENKGSDCIISVYINGERAAQKSVTLNPGAALPVDFDIPLTVSGQVTITAGLEEDDITGDNLRYASFYVPERLNTLLLYDTAEDIQFLQPALQAAFGSEKFSLTARTSSSAGGTDLSTYNAIVMVTGVGAINSAPLRKYLDAGKGGIMLFPSVQVKPDIYKNLLQSFGLPPSGLLTGAPGNTTRPFYFDKTELSHPLFTGIFEKGKEKAASPDIYSYLQFFPGGRGKSIIALADGTAALSEHRIGNGRILCFTIPPSLEYSNLPLKGIFVPMLYRSVYYLSGTGQKDSSSMAGEALRFTVPSAKKDQLKLSRPSGDDEYISDDMIQSGLFTWRATGRTGIYDLVSGSEVLDRKSVNHDPAESVTASANETELKEYFNKSGAANEPVILDYGAALTEEINQARFGTELWKFFLLLALLTAITEMAVARVGKKELIVNNE